MENATLLWNIIKRKKYVSFDIFDTLIKRNVPRPRDIFKIIESSYNRENAEHISDFYQKRKEAEKQCREKSAREEITLSDIYKEIDYPFEVSSNLLKLEVETELQFCQANLAMVNIYQKCILDEKVVILTSDMYLPEKEVIQILAKNGIFDYRKIYLSSTIGLQKGTGSLYKYVLNDLKISATEIVHIGDSFVSDYIRPIQCGIRSVHIKRSRNNLTYVNDKEIFQGDSLIWCFVNNNILKYAGCNDVFRLGYETFGPLILGFSYWIHRRIQETNSRKAFFLARDMYLFVDTYRKLFPEDEVVYLEVSRRSLRRTFVKSQGDIRAVLNTLGRSKYTVRDICNALDIKTEGHLVMDTSFDEKVSSSADYDKLQKFIFTKLNEQEDFTEEYLRQEGLFDSSENVIVDIGWHGTIQNMLEGILNKTIKGLYLGNTKRKNYKKLDSEGYWFNNEDESEVINNISLVGILEVMLSPNVGTTMSYQRQEGRIVPIHRYSEALRFDVIEEFQKGTLTFIHDIVKFLENGLLGTDLLNFFDMTATSCMHAYINMAYRPSLKVAKLFGECDYEDNRTTKLAKPKKAVQYIFNPRSLFVDYRECKWKVGFIKQLVPVCRRPDMIDAIIKRIHN